MSRLQALIPPYPRDVQERLDAITPTDATPLVLFKTVATSGRAWTKLVGGSLLDPGPLGLREREIVIDRTCALAGCEYEWGVHIAFFGRQAKLTPEEVRATVHGSAGSTCWSPAEAVLIATCDALHHHARLDDEEFAALREHYDNDQILEIVQLCGYYRTISYLVGAFDLPLEEQAARFPS